MKWLFAAVALAYPLLIFADLDWLDARLLGLFAATVVVTRLVMTRRAVLGQRRALWFPVLGLVAVLLLFAAKSDDKRYLSLLPALVNAVLLVTFGASLWKSQPVVETIARLQAGSLSATEVVYCRTVTKVWCGFFVLNTTAIAWLALQGTPAQWAWFTGFFSYLLAGALFSTEYVYRHYRFRRYVGAPTDALLRRIFPPHETRGGQP